MSINANVPASWSGTEELTGIDLVDKAELIGVPFRITAVWFDVNQRDIEYAYVEGERVDGTTFTFNDSSSGVRVQLENVVKAKGVTEIPGPDNPLDIKLIIPKGLRVSTFEVKDEMRRTKMAKTYYLTTNGVRATGTAAPVAEKKTAAKR